MMRRLCLSTCQVESASPKEEIVRCQAGSGNVCQCQRTARVLGDYDARANLGRVLHYLAEAVQHRVGAEADHVVVFSGWDEVQDCIGAEIGTEGEGVTAGTTDEHVVS